MSTGFEDAPSFPTKLRGFDQAQVNSFIAGQTERIAELLREREMLVARLEQTGETSIDFNSFADELRHILEAAHQAADTLRNRATAEVTSWRESARKEVETSKREAVEAAENLRRDAWIAAETLIEQSQEESKSAVEDAARESLAIVGKAERDAHRIQSNARREAEELMRLTRMESERLLVDARGQHDSIIEQARTQADAAQERARSLEVRRVELLTELDSVQVAVARLEDDLKRKREELEAAPPPPPAASFVESSVRVVTKPEKSPTDWDNDGIKVIPAQPKVTESPGDPIDATEMAEEVRRLKKPERAVAASDSDEEPEFSIIKIIPAKRADPEEDSASVDEAAPDQALTEGVGSVDGVAPDDGSDGVAADEADEAGEPTLDVLPGDPPDFEPSDLETQDAETPGGVESAPSKPVGDIPEVANDFDLGGLFAALRETAEVPVVQVLATALPVESTKAKKADAEDPATDRTPVMVEAPVDALELRDHLLLPIMNRVLRDIKRQLTEAQNIALEQLRVADDEWEPNVAELVDRVHGDLTIVAQEAFAAGYEAVASMTGQSPGRPKSRKSDIPNVSGEFAEAIAADLVTAAAKGDGPRAAAAAVSRAYRAWRTDTAERRVRAIARAAYHRGIARALVGLEEPSMVWAVAGRGCVECRTMAEAGPVGPDDGFAGGVVPPLHPECSCTVVRST